MSDICDKINILYVKLTICFTLLIHLTEKLYFVLIKILPHFLNHPYITEKLSTQISISYHSLSNHAEVSVYKLYNLILRSNLHHSNLIKLIR